MYDHPGSDTGEEWVELFNAGAVPIDLTKWKINDGSNHVLNVPPKNGGVGSIVIASGEYLVLASNAIQFETEHPSVTNVIDTTLSLPNAQGVISLVDASSTIKDTASYNSSLGGAGDGNSLNRTSAGATFIPHTPSPGAVASATVIPPPPPKAVPPKNAATSKKASSSGASSHAKTAISPGTGVANEGVIGDPTSDVSTTDNDPSSATDQSQVAGAAAAISFSWWWIAAAALALLGGAAMFVSRSKAKGEWDIIEQKD